MNPQFVYYHPQTDSHSQHAEQITNPHLLPYHFPTGNSNNFDQIASYTAANNWEYGNLHEFGEQSAEINGGNGKVLSKKGIFKKITSGIILL